MSKYLCGIKSLEFSAFWFLEESAPGGRSIKV
uniref:Uncharacterized protein n=1 Tax=Rhizophora mucronata TaxID=61149 RepID=A0A2P2QVY5_RHIMU